MKEQDDMFFHYYVQIDWGLTGPDVNNGKLLCREVVVDIRWTYLSSRRVRVEISEVWDMDRDTRIDTLCMNVCIYSTGKVMCDANTSKFIYIYIYIIIICVCINTN